MNSDYIDKKMCNVVKGFFILVVFFSHFQQYVEAAGGWTINTHLGQLIVAMFLFYSGFGVMESIKRKGVDYIRSIPKRRVLTTLLNFDVAVLAFIAVDLLTGQPITLKQSLLSFVCWDSIGNSNWYIFAIICCYALTWVVYGVLRLEKSGVWLVSMFAGALILALGRVKESWWYDTLLCYPTGMVYSQYRKVIEIYVAKHYWCTLVSMFLSFLLFRHCGYTIKGFIHNAEAIFFAVMIVLLTMKLQIKSRILSWCGEHLFPLYIYQRIPMIVLFSFTLPSGVDPNVTWLYFLPCLIFTVFIAMCYKKWQITLD